MRNEARTLEELLAEQAEAVRPAERLNVAEFAEKYRVLDNPGSYVGPFRYEKTPYMREPAEELTSLDFKALAFVGPARTGKSDQLLNWIGQTAKLDPVQEMMVVHMTQSSARDWSQGDLRKMFRDSPEIGALVAKGRQNQNTHDVKFKSGMRLLIKWPTITELSGKTTRYVWLVDYDRFPPDIDKEGPAFNLARKRTGTFKRHGMTVVESSPGYLVREPKWRPSTPHEAPPVGDEKGGGILTIYNQGDRRRWYWRCPQCREAFEPSFKLMSWPDSLDKIEAAEQAVLVCPHDGFPITNDLKYELNLGGKWIKEGQAWMPDGSVKGRALRSEIASFWMKGPAAGFTDFKDLVIRHLNAMETWKQTGAEEELKATVTLDQGEPYLPRALQSDRLPEQLKERALDWGSSELEPTVPEGVRFLTTTVDVQAGAKPSFVVQVHGHGVGNDIWFIDMFKIRKSERLDKDGERELIDPAAYPEDWDQLIPLVIERTYPLADGSGRRMKVKAIGCDSGGKAGVTANAYAFWRRLRDDKLGRGHQRRFQLVKGEASKMAPRIREVWPDSGQKGLNAIARGDVPVLLINSDMVKDMVAHMLARSEPGGMVRFPHWTPDFIYKQLTTEIRTAKGWENPPDRRNEAWDLLYYSLGVCLHKTIRIEHIKWDAPPIWAAEWDDNDMVFAPVEGAAPEWKKRRKSLDFKALGEKLA